MCRAAVAGGVRTIVATPRWEDGSVEPPLPFAECRRRAESLESEMRGSLSVRLGFALQFSADLPGLAARHGAKLALGGGRHLLVSLPSVEVPSDAERVWEALARGGFSVVLAHPECNTLLRRDASRLTRWVSEGVTLQIDAASVTGAHGREVKRFAVECLHKYEGRVAVASNVRRGAEQRSCLGRARDVLAEAVGAGRAETLVAGTPAALIGDGVGRKDARGASTHGLGSLFRAFSPIKALTGD
jgi:protein-tyrosine phosphatase